MKSHPGCELCTCWTPFESLTCLYEIIFSLWIVMHLMGSIWITDMSFWNPIQVVSCCALPGLHLNHWHVSMKSHPESELLCTFWALLESLICSHKITSSLWVVLPPMDSIWITDMSLWNPIQAVSCHAPHGLYLNHWHVFMKFYPGCELLHISWAPFELFICLHEIPFRKWVVVCFIGSIWITDMPLWNLIQGVSYCTSPGLHLNH